MSLPALELPRLAPRLRTYWWHMMRRTFWGTAATNFLMPLLYLTAMGVGLGSFVDTTTGRNGLGGLSYLSYIAPGLLATTAMQAGVFETTYPVMGGFKWDRVYYSMVATPLGAADIVVSQLVFIAVRIALAGGVFLAIMAAYGAVESWWGAVAALATAVLLGLAFAAPMMGLSSRLRDESGFSLIFRLGLIPMFLFSGAFFPVGQLGVFAWLAYVTPIWHGVDLTRMLTTAQVSVWPTLGHVAYLGAWVGFGLVFAVTGFRRRLFR